MTFDYAPVPLAMLRKLYRKNKRELKFQRKSKEKYFKRKVKRAKTRREKEEGGKKQTKKNAGPRGCPLCAADTKFYKKDTTKDLQ